LDARRSAFLACATVVEEALPLLPEGMPCQVLDFGLHVDPERLRDRLQTKIDKLGASLDTVVLGYGLCSMAVVGLKPARCTLVIPRVDDCIDLFLGSCTARRRQTRQEPGTYYLTKGWIEANDTPFSEHECLVERYGPKLAERMTRLVLKNYTRVAYIDTGKYDQERYREYARQAAARFGLRYEEIPGSTALIRKMVHGPWDDDFVVAPPGATVGLADFKRVRAATSRPALRSRAAVGAG
jgi:hypothetical protein